MASVAKGLWRAVRALGVPTVYGLPGTTNLAALDALAETDLRFVTARHEQAAGHMADASARLAGSLGVALLDLGPGLANATIAILAAARDSVPLLVVAGNEERWLLDREVWHEMPEVATYAALAKFVARVETGGDFPRLLQRAVATAVSGRPGPVLLSIPKDVWAEPVPDSWDCVVVPAAARPQASDVAATLELLRQANRPLLLAGGGARHATEALGMCVEQLRLPVVTSPNGRGILPEDHPLCLGHAGRFGQRQASTALKDADVLLVVGCRLDDLATHNWSLLGPHTRTIQVDACGAMMGRNTPIERGITADAGLFLADLAACADGPLDRAWAVTDRVAERQAARTAFYAIADERAVKPQAVMHQLELQLDAEHTVIMGGGRFQQFVGEWLVRSPRHFFYAANSGAMGYALPAAIAAALTCPDRQVVCCLGDGDVMMNVQELETAVRETAPIKVVVFNDFAYGAMKARQARPIGTDLGNPDFGALAQCFGAAGRVLERGNDVADAVAWLVDQDGPAVLDVRMDTTEDRSLLYGHDIGTRE